MAIQDLIDTVKFDFNAQSIDYTQKNCSQDNNNNNAFLNVFQSANKNYNSSSQDLSQLQDVNQYNQNSAQDLSQSQDVSQYKGFKSDYENFYNKLDTNKNSDNQIKQDSANQAKNQTDNATTDNKTTTTTTTSTSTTTIAETKDPQEKLNKNTKKVEDNTSIADQKNTEISKGNKEQKAKPNKETKETSEEKNNIVTKSTDVNAENINLNAVIQSNLQNIDISSNKEAQPQPVLPKIKEDNAVLQKTNDAVELKVDNSVKNLPEELNSIQKQIANEKITNKQAEKISQQQPATVEEKTSTDQTQTTKINPEELQKTAIKTTDQPATPVQSQKPEILATDNVLNNLNAADKNQIKQPQSNNLKPVSSKLAEVINNEDSKPIVTSIDVKSISSKMDSGSQDKQQNQQDLKSGINQIQALSTDENNSQKIDIQKTSQFDKILNIKQTQPLENSVLNQLKDKISTDLTDNKSQISIILRPENLGKVNINIVSQDGVVTAQITAENSQVKDILNKGLETLKQNLAEQGVTVGKMVVNVQEHSSSMNSDQNQKNFDQANSNTSNMNYQSGKQNFSEQDASGSSNNQSYGFDEEAENENKTNESNILTGQSPVIRAGQVDYKV